MGCGRIFEGTHEEMFNSLNKIKNLPQKQKYIVVTNTQKIIINFVWNMTRTTLFLKKETFIDQKLQDKSPTIPTTIDDELKTNIFLRCDNESVKNIGINNASDILTFKELKLKDSLIKNLDLRSYQTIFMEFKRYLCHLQLKQVENNTKSQLANYDVEKIDNEEEIKDYKFKKVLLLNDQYKNTEVSNLKY